jgi:signal peptidase I
MPPDHEGEELSHPLDPVGEPPETAGLKPAAKPPPRRHKSRSPFRSLLEVALIFAGAILVAYLLQAYIVKPFQIPSESMEPTIDPGDRILVNRLSGSIERGDIIVFQAPPDPNVDYVKRVIGLPGDTIEVKRGQVIVNGEPQDETYLHAADLSSFETRTVPEGNLFVMGDNRSNSQDSRYWDPPWLPMDNVIGKAFFIYWPPGRMGTL